VSTPDIEALVCKAVKYMLSNDEEICDRDLLLRHVECFVIHAGRTAVTPRSRRASRQSDRSHESHTATLGNGMRLRA
jgi:hypothetical protein